MSPRLMPRCLDGGVSLLEADQSVAAGWWAWAPGFVAAPEGVLLSSGVGSGQLSVWPSWRQRSLATGGGHEWRLLGCRKQLGRTG